MGRVSPEVERLIEWVFSGVQLNYLSSGKHTSENDIINDRVNVGKRHLWADYSSLWSAQVPKYGTFLGYADFHHKERLT
jgi:hypothetical protein